MFEQSISLVHDTQKAEELKKKSESYLLVDSVLEVHYFRIILASFSLSINQRVEVSHIGSRIELTLICWS